MGSSSKSRKFVAEAGRSVTSVDLSKSVDGVAIKNSLVIKPVTVMSVVIVFVSFLAKLTTSVCPDSV